MARANPLWSALVLGLAALLWARTALAQDPTAPIPTGTTTTEPPSPPPPTKPPATEHPPSPPPPPPPPPQAEKPTARTDLPPDQAEAPSTFAADWKPRLLV